MKSRNPQQGVSVAVIGAGVSGLAAGIRLQRAGVPFTVFEKASAVGGTWRENRYPGLTIDVPSALYTFREFRHPGWRRWMPDQPEILEYLEDVATRSGLRERIRLECPVNAARWTGAGWEVDVGAGERQRFTALICATGFLHHPRIPPIDGLEAFTGELTHSARWREEIETRGRRVGVIGNGSTGVQLTTALSGVASHLTLFQRTAQWIFPVPNFTIPPVARAVLARVPGLMDLEVEGLLRFADWFLGGATIRPGRRRRLISWIARRRLRQVTDPVLRAALTPPEEPLCRRPIVSMGFYDAVQHPDVSVVTERIDRVEPAGVRTADGRLHELDVLVLATGFEAHSYMRPIRIEGVDGVTLDDAWRDGPHGYRTIGLPGFPNLFMLIGPHTPLVAHSIHESAELQMDYVAQLLDVIAREGVSCLAPTPEATTKWLQSIREGMPGTVFATGCRSWYVGDGTTPVLWPYDRRRWKAMLRAPDLADFEIETVAVPEPLSPASV